MGSKWIKKGVKGIKLKWKMLNTNGQFQNELVCLRNELEFEEKEWD